MYDLGTKGSKGNALPDGELIPPRPTHTPYPQQHPHPTIFKPCAAVALRTGRQKGEASPVSSEDNLLLQV